jgi:archaellum component FlaC
MQYKYLKSIDFSDGIRDDEVQHNFDAITEQVGRERLYTAGYGVAQGLEFKLDIPEEKKWINLKLTEGTLIDRFGSEIYFKEQTIQEIKPPEIFLKEEIVQVTKEGFIYLSYIPYSNTGLETVESSFIIEDAKKVLAPSYIFIKYGLSAFDYDNQAKSIAINDINGQRLTVDLKLANTLVKVKYAFSGERYDVVYINENDLVKVYTGLTSSSPSVSLPSKLYDPDKTDEENKNSYKSIIGFVNIDAYHGVNKARGKATIVLKKDLRSVRNIYTDKENVLYICGIPFKSLQLIHMEQPEEMKENDLWYDKQYNKFKICKNNDGILDWVTINDPTYTPAYEVKLWAPQENPSDLQTFVFDDINLNFYPGTNSLELLIDQTPLHCDQFSEIVSPLTNGEYVNTGIGFKLAAPLEKQSYVEVRVRQIVSKNPLPNRFQRSATFVDVGVDTYNADSNLNIMFTTSAPYRYGENQLEVFIEGKRLDINKDFQEGVDLTDAQKVKGAVSNKFKITSTIANGNNISYKISSTVYSYDHIYKLVGDLEENIKDAATTVSDTLTTINNFMSNVISQLETNTQKINSIQSDVNNMKNSINNIQDDYISTNDTITEYNLPTNMLVPKGKINKEYLITSGLRSFNVTDSIAPEDFINVFNITVDGGNKIMKPEIDFSVVRELNTGKVMLNILSGSIPDNSTIYINGIKFK